jgi:hypothetical protein
MKTGPKPRGIHSRLVGKYVIDENGCWIWTATKGKNGYGHIMADRLEGEPPRMIGAHVASFLVHKGPIPRGYEVDHRCQVNACVNPDHLEAVTHSVNIARSWGLHGRRRRAATLAAIGA